MKELFKNFYVTEFSKNILAFDYMLCISHIMKLLKHHFKKMNWTWCFYDLLRLFQKRCQSRCLS